MIENSEIIISDKSNKSPHKVQILKEMNKKNFFGRPITEKQARDKVAQALRHMRKRVSNPLFIDYRKKLTEAERTSLIDPLTGLYNRRFFFGEETDPHATGEMRRIFSAAIRSRKDLSVLMIDVDNFKDVNDTYGHPIGDYVLKNLAYLLPRICRPSDIVGRHGGEEFIIVSQDTDLDAVIKLAERVRTDILRFNFNPYNEHKPREITASIGVACYSPADKDNKYKIRGERDLVGLADEAMYLAKKSGKNNVKSMQDLPKS